MKKWFDTDTFREILDSLLRNKSRSLLTGFGVFWGVFMLMLLSGGGQGLNRLLLKNFDGFAQNSCTAYAWSTNQAYHGFPINRRWHMEYNDVTRLKNLVPELETVTPTLMVPSNTISRNDYTYSKADIKGARADFALIETPKLLYGRFLNDADIAQERKVCVIGKKVYASLFPEGGDPCGQWVEIDGVFYVVIGVDDRGEGAIQINGSPADGVTIPITFARRTYNSGNTVTMINCTAKPGFAMNDITPRIRSILYRAHDIAPTDNQALFLFNNQMIFSIVENLLKGVSFLIWLVGIGTLLAGIVGVSNIMMVSVRERTTEIGIRRAIGATPLQILGQIISESIILTVITGLTGIVASVGILAVVDKLMPDTPFQVPFWTAMLAVLLLSVLGVVAGLMPASRAMAIKPVDAMRDE